MHNSRLAATLARAERANILALRSRASRKRSPCSIFSPIFPILLLRLHVTNNAHHRTDQFSTIPRRAEDVHPAQLYDAVHSVTTRRYGEEFLSVRIPNSQTQRLKCAIKFRDY